MSMEVSPMCAADLDAVVALERRCHAFPWTRGNFTDSLAAGHGAWLAREASEIAAYAVVMPAPDEVHLLNITVAPELQRGGRGAALLQQLFDLARHGKANRMLLEVRPGNVAALALYRRHGFAEIGRRRGYYPAANGREDAIVMAREL